MNSLFPIIRFVTNFFENRHFYVSVGNEYSDLLPITSGVLMGSISGPTFYNIFTADFTTPGSDTGVILFDDDKPIFSSIFHPDKTAKEIENNLAVLLHNQKKDGLL